VQIIVLARTRNPKIVQRSTNISDIAKFIGAAMLGASLEEFMQEIATR
jgi:hypothetical protein